MASKADFLENKVLDHFLGKASFTLVTPIYMALCTAIPTDASTGATLVEATYTGYARKSIAAADLNAAAAGNITNLAAIIFAACTGGSSTIIGFALTDNPATGAGNVHYWGTTTSKLIDVSNTPPTVGVSGLSVFED
jgi:hypothetical protein